MSARGNTWLPVILGLLVLAGGALSAELWRSHLEVYEGGVSGGAFCGGGGLFDCDAVAAHPSSTLAGFPLPVFGLLFYAALLYVTLAAAALRGEHRRALVGLGSIAALLAVLFDAYLALVLWLDVGAACGLCLGTYGVNLALAVLFRAWERRLPDAVRWSRLLPSLRGLRGTDAEHHREAFKACALGVALVCLGALHVGAVLPFARAHASGVDRVRDLTARIVSSPPTVDMTRFEGQPSLGPEDAALWIAAVGDFQCAYCRSLARSLERWRDARPDLLRVFFVHSPLSSECNPLVPEVVHEDACWLAAAAEAAHNQGRFWELHDHLFALPPNAVSPERVRADLAALGVDAERFELDLAQGRGAERIARDVELCRELGLSTTPSLVFGGHVVRGGLPPWMFDELMATLVGGVSR